MIPVARNVWQQVDAGRSAAAARRLIIARTRRRDSARPVSLRPAGSTLWKSAALPPRAEPPRDSHRGPRPPDGGPGRRDVCRPSREPEPTPALLPEVVLPPHPDRRAHPREAVEHHRDERPVAQARERARVNRVEEPAGLGQRHRRRRALRDHVLRPPDGRGQVHREDMADDEPVAKHGSGKMRASP